MATINISCHFCNKTHGVKKHVMGKAGRQRYSVMTVAVHFISNEYEA